MDLIGIYIIFHPKSKEHTFFSARQLAEAMAKEMEKQTDKMKDNGSSKPMTKEEARNQQLADITQNHPINNNEKS